MYLTKLYILFIHFGITDAIDILLVAIILYLLYNMVKGTSAVNIFIGLALIYVVWIVTKAFELKLLSSLMGKFVNVGVIAIMVVFQQEIRKFLLYIGSNEFIRSRNWRNILKFNINKAEEGIELDVDELITACFNMSETKTGALIIISRKSDLKFYINSGEKVDSALTARMLENIFFKNSPLHDGAVIIINNRIVAARCVLPVTEKENFPANYGMRHRAAVGITETTDAIAISVSEQTGAVSLTTHGEINAGLTREKLRFLLEKNIR
ncbi:MAG TPA: diadenylate cyclase CdaA [Bacteroidia bacterium]|nr:diadenylate cyclase CdaA [Bacteroidota bacterium]HRD40720.1 diadenylate cyclase CdaA [Bacteroidia bacterium]